MILTVVHSEGRLYDLVWLRFLWGSSLFNGVCANGVASSRTAPGGSGNPLRKTRALIGSRSLRRVAVFIAGGGGGDNRSSSATSTLQSQSGEKRPWIRDISYRELFGEKHKTNKQSGDKRPGGHLLAAFAASGDSASPLAVPRRGQSHGEIPRQLGPRRSADRETSPAGRPAVPLEFTPINKHIRGWGSKWGGVLTRGRDHLLSLWGGVLRPAEVSPEMSGQLNPRLRTQFAD